MRASPICLVLLALASSVLSHGVPMQVGGPHVSVTDLAVGVGSIALDANNGSATLLLGAVDTSKGLGGGFMIVYSPDDKYPTTSLIAGTVTCLNVSWGVGHVTGLIALSYGPYASPFPVGNYITLAVSWFYVNPWNASAGAVCAPYQSPTQRLESGFFVVY